MSSLGRGAALLISNVEVTGAAQLYRAASGGLPGWGASGSFRQTGFSGEPSENAQRDSVLKLLRNSMHGLSG